MLSVDTNTPEWQRSARIGQEWKDFQAAREALNKAVRAKFHVGQPVKAYWNMQFRDAVVSWVPYENGPPATHIYIQFPSHKTPKRFDMGGGVFSGVIIP